MLIAIAIVLGVFMLIAGFIALHHEKLSVGIIATGLVSLFASILFLLLAAPDVAMTEAAIGSGLTTVIFFYVLNKIRQRNG